MMSKRVSPSRTHEQTGVCEAADTVKLLCPPEWAAGALGVEATDVDAVPLLETAAATKRQFLYSLPAGYFLARRCILL